MSDFYNDNKISSSYARTQNISSWSQMNTHMNYGGNCIACDGNGILDDRGLCLARCTNLIPEHIPEQQYKRYRDRVVLGKLPNT